MTIFNDDRSRNSTRTVEQFGEVVPFRRIVWIVVASRLC
jgi:hypothetical protein